MAALPVVALLLLSVIISHLTLRNIVRVTRGPLLTAFLWPGVFIHECGHLIACVVTGTRVIAFRTLLQDGGEVIHEATHHHLLQLLISLAPILSGLAVLIGLTYGLAPQLLTVQGEPSAILGQTLPLIGGLIQQKQGIIYLLLVVSISATLAPSKEDLGNATSGLVVGISLFLALLILQLFNQGTIGVTAPSWSTAWLTPLWLIIVLQLLTLIIVTFLAQLRRLSRR